MRPVVTALLLLLAGCAVPGLRAATPTASMITREQAIRTALEIAASSAPEVSGALVPPQNIRAEQLTLSQATQRMSGNTNLPQGYNGDMAVWYVTMDGLWASEVQAPGVTATQVPYHHYMIVLDALTALEIEGSLRP